MLIRHVVDGGFPRGPRLARLAFSEVGANFSVGQPFNIPSGTDPSFDSTVVDFSSAVSAQFIQIEILEGWQIAPIAIESIQFLDRNDRVIQGQIQSIAIRLPPNRCLSARSGRSLLCPLFNSGDARSGSQSTFGDR